MRVCSLLETIRGWGSKTRSVFHGCLRTQKSGHRGGGGDAPAGAGGCKLSASARAPSDPRATARPVWERNLLVHRPTSAYLTFWDKESGILSDVLNVILPWQEFLMFLSRRRRRKRSLRFCGDVYRCKFNSFSSRALWNGAQIRLMRDCCAVNTCSTSQLMMAKLYKNHHKAGFLCSGSHNNSYQSLPWAGSLALCAFACDSCGTRRLRHFSVFTPI